MTALTVGGALSILNGAVHFLLPVCFPWTDRLAGRYEPLEWALFATIFGLLLVLGGVLTIAVMRLRGVPTSLVLLVAGGRTAFWGLATVYEFAFPFPAPVASWLLPTISGAVAALHAAGVPCTRQILGHPTARPGPVTLEPRNYLNEGR